MTRHLTAVEIELFTFALPQKPWGLICHMQALCLPSETIMSVVLNDLELCAMAISSTLHACRVLCDHDSSNRMGPRCIVP